MIQPFKFIMSFFLMGAILSGWLILGSQIWFAIFNVSYLAEVYQLFYVLNIIIGALSIALIAIEVFSQKLAWKILSHRIIGISLIGSILNALWVVSLQLQNFWGDDISSFQVTSSIISGLFIVVLFYLMFWWGAVVNDGMKMEREMSGLITFSIKELIRKITVSSIPAIIIFSLWIISEAYRVLPIHWILDWRVVLGVITFTLVRNSQLFYRIQGRGRQIILLWSVVVLVFGTIISAQSFIRHQTVLNHFRVHAICQEGLVYISEPKPLAVALYVDSNIPFHVKQIPVEDYNRVKEVYDCGTAGESIQKYRVEEVTNIPTEKITTDVPEDWREFSSPKYGFRFSLPEAIEVNPDPELETVPSVHEYFSNDVASLYRIRPEDSVNVQTFLRERKKNRCDYLRAGIEWSLVDRLELAFRSCAEAVQENLAYKTIESDTALAYVETGTTSTRFIMEIRPKNSKPGGFLILEVVGYNEEDPFVHTFLSGFKFE